MTPSAFPLHRVAAPAWSQASLALGQGAAEHAQRAHLNVRERTVAGGNVSAGADAGMGRPSVRR
jgi:hypothetical protein